MTDQDPKDPTEIDAANAARASQAAGIADEIAAYVAASDDDTAPDETTDAEAHPS